MPASKNILSKINLLPQDEFEKSLLGKILRWSLTAGKSIVIMTEFVVIMAFLSRFWLDRQVNDLNEVLMQKQAVVGSYVEIEQRMRTIQERVDAVKKIDQSTLMARSALGSVIASTPVDVVYESIDISRTTLSLTGIAGSENGFASLLNGIRDSGDWSQVSLGNVEFNQRKGGVIFTINARASVETPSPTSAPEVEQL